MRLMISLLLGAAVVTLLPAAGCSSSSSGEADPLQSSCVHRNITSLSRTLADGEACYNVGYADCGTGMASRCIHDCAFDLCQAQPCVTDTDCAALHRVCQPYVVEFSQSVSFGNWCAVSTCPLGTAGCPCRAGACDSPFQCSAQNVCTDTCPTGCRQKSVCCGGALCSGDCVGTPCC